MHKIDKNECIECGFCEAICPVGAIKKTEIAYEITEKCIDCGLCAKNCPVTAIEKISN